MSIIPTGKPAEKGQLADTGQPLTAPTTANVQATSSLGRVAPGMPSHAQVLTVTPLNHDATIVPMTPQQIADHQAPSSPVADAAIAPAQSLTVTPLPSNVTVLLMTPDQIGALGPPRPKRPESLEFGPMTTRRSGANLLYSFRLRGVAVNSPLTTTILQILDQQLKRKLIDYSRSDPKLMEDGDLEISLTARNFKGTTTTVENVYTGVRFLFSKIRDLGVSERDCTTLWDELIFENLSYDDWDQTQTGILERALFIRCLLALHEFNLAFPLLRDLADVCHQTAWHHLLEGQWVEANGLSLIRDKYPITSRELTELAFERLKEYSLTRTPRLAQTGRMLLPSILDPAFQTDLHNDIREELFTAIRDLRKGCGTKEADALLQDLLDLPDDVRGEVLLDPRARRLLLMAFPALVDVLENIEANAYQVFLDRIKTLEDCGIVFSGTPLADAPVEIDGAHVDDYIVSNLIDLAEAAVMCAGRINWATGVLQFLSDRALYEHDYERLKELRDRIQLAVKFDPDPQVVATFETVKALTDRAIAELAWLED